MKKIAALMALWEVTVGSRPARATGGSAGPSPTVIPAGYTMQGIPLPTLLRNTVRWWAKP